jgi:hypothetical protein
LFDFFQIPENYYVETIIMQNMSQNIPGASSASFAATDTVGTANQTRVIPNAVVYTQVGNQTLVSMTGELAEFFKDMDNNICKLKAKADAYALQFNSVCEMKIQDEYLLAYARNLLENYPFNVFYRKKPVNEIREEYEFLRKYVNLLGDIATTLTTVINRYKNVIERNTNTLDSLRIRCLLGKEAIILIAKETYPLDTSYDVIEKGGPPNTEVMTTDIMDNIIIYEELLERMLVENYHVHREHLRGMINEVYFVQMPPYRSAFNSH